MTTPFKNYSELGSFGEFVYKRFGELQNFTVERTNSSHTDFHLTSNDGSRQCHVDVKSSVGKLSQYVGRRHHDEIIYDRVSVIGDWVYLVPDINSPFKHEVRVLKVDYLATLLGLWRCSPVGVNRRKRLTTEEVRDDLGSAAVSKYPRLRFVERGDAHRDGWDGTVDNLPGSLRTIEKYDATVFLLYKFEYESGVFKQPLSEIMFFPHDLINDDRILRKANGRQEGKGIKKVVDVDAFRSQHPCLVFKGIEGLKGYLRGDLAPCGGKVS